MQIRHADLEQVVRVCEAMRERASSSSISSWRVDYGRGAQPFGTKSKQSLSDMCFGKEAEITPFVKDRYQRIVASVKCAGVDVNSEQVNRGMAWVCRRYAKDHDLYVLEQGAKVEKRGIWG